MHRRAALAGMAALVAGPARAAEPQTVAEIAAPLLIEGIAHDGRSLYLGAIAGRQILTLDPAGLPSVLPVGPLLGVFGMACRGRRLWAATADLAHPGQSELIEIDLERHRVVGRYRPPRELTAAIFGDVALGDGGEVFVSDSKGSVLRMRRGGALQALVPPGKLRSPQGMVLDGGSLIVADYASGLHRVDLATGALTVIEGGGIRGIDGLVRHGGDLIAIQNGASRPRVIRLPIAKPADAEILVESGVLIEPSLGTVVGDRLLFVGRSQWGEANDKGEVKPGAGPTRIMSLALPKP
jgi:hypothetical protein